MYGIAGFLAYPPVSDAVIQAAVVSMAQRIELRTLLVDARRLLLRTFFRFLNKILLAVVPQKSLLHEIITRKNTGFGNPVERWLLEIQNGRAGMGSKDWSHNVCSLYDASIP